MMHDFVKLAISGVIGMLLGALFFGGLWWTMRTWLVAHRSPLWLVASWALRMGVVLTGFYFVGHEHWQRLLVSLLGFIMARLVVNRLIRLPMDAQPEQV